MLRLAEPAQVGACGAEPNPNPGPNQNLHKWEHVMLDTMATPLDEMEVSNPNPNPNTNPNPLPNPNPHP